MNARETDVVALLTGQHEEIIALFPQAAESEQAFRRLARLLTAHEAAEQEVVHPHVRRQGGGRDSMIDDRLREEHEIKRQLSALDEMGTGHPDFPAQLESLRIEVLAHARAEERYEFSCLATLEEQARTSMIIALTATTSRAAVGENA
ncbi:hemerythrin domain-containing protein [Herbidospora galbida]|uniref:Hemerythrin domain-containing protein n=1 Tax=Herbidospora galbida TaxID=2575442 RepID=A0A4U3MMN1_9ACTN|nr:hemerythrin domain-containing protein [Herbidospora galbida]TKK90835.1 hemerythrin domain-containing protein [Herbidospora galbida]